jgi:hypothetical protein
MRRAIATAAGALLALAMLMGTPALAHEGREIKGFEVECGWGVEPANAGFQNSVQFFANHRNGDPVKNADLTAVVIFGQKDGEQQSEPIALEPAFGSPGEFDGTIIPTRPGTYTFHITGTLDGVDIGDQFFTSSDTTFDDVHNPADAEFPAKDPTRGELGQALSQTSERVQALERDLQDAADDASRAAVIGYAALGLGAIALLVAALKKPTVKKG